MAEEDTPAGKPKQRNLSDLSPEEVMSFRKGCELGDGAQCTLFGICLGQDPDVGGKRVGKFLRKGCEMGDSNGCVVLSSWQLGGRVPGTVQSAFQNFRTSCQMGNVQGCLHTGRMMLSGAGTEVDVAGGLQLLLAGCYKAQHGQSCFEAAHTVARLADAGMLAEDEAACKQNVRELLQRACDNSYAKGCEALQEFNSKFPEEAAQPVQGISALEEAARESVQGGGPPPATGNLNGAPGGESEV